MISLVETGLMNALLAVALALPVLILGRLWHRPALIHAFWILVLIKLVSPPLFQVPVNLQVSIAPVEQIAASQGRAVSTSSTPGSALGHLDSPSSTSASQPASAWYSMLGDMIRQWQQWIGWTLSMMSLLIVPALCVWVIGAVCWFGWQGWRVVRFAQVFLRSAQIAPEFIQEKTRSLGRRMGLKKCPEVWLLPHVVSPMLWSVGGQPRILFPTELLSRLDECAVATLLTHELAHFHRGDHHVRMLEFVASGCFWWHPVVWLARREMEIAEEQCCDAWVVSQFPASQRRYADALLTTVDFLSEDHPPVPALASGLGDVPMLRERLKLIMCGTAPKSLSGTGRLTVLLTGLLIPFSPTLRPQSQASQAPPLPARIAALIPTQNANPVHSHATRIRQEIAKLSRSIEASRLSRNGLSPEMVKAIGELASMTSHVTADSRIAANGSQRSPATASKGRLPPRVWAMASSPNQSSRIVAWTNGNVEWQRVKDGKKFDLTTYRISTIQYSAEGDVFISGCRDGIVRVWDASTCQLIAQLEGHQAPVRAIALSPQGTRLATADQHGVVLLWTLTGAADVRTLTRSNSAVNSLAFSADGQTLALGTGTLLSTDSAQLQVWDLLTESMLACLNHQSPLAVVRLSADGKSVSGAEWDGTLLTWDLESSTVVSRRQVNRVALPAAAFAPQS